MGTNYYTLKSKHIGKRSAAGKYCWDCNTTLCKEGNDAVHTGSGYPLLNSGDMMKDLAMEIKRSEEKWYDECPICHKKPDKEGVDNNAAGRELGFNKEPYKRKTGIKSCSSFTWAVSPSNLSKVKYVRDEYGRKMTIK